MLTASRPLTTVETTSWRLTPEGVKRALSGACAIISRGTSLSRYRRIERRACSNCSERSWVQNLAQIANLAAV
jgi:hypothetical protein